MKKMILMACSCLALLMPIGVSAHANTTYNLLAESDGFCHCGYPREKTTYIKSQAEPCPEKGHGPSCGLYVSHWIATYHYCTNDRCGDNYQDPWEFIKYQHL